MFYAMVLKVICKIKSQIYVIVLILTEVEIWQHLR